jgi:prevent-host-death family protein
VTIQLNIHEAKTQLSDLLERAQRDEEVIIAKAGKPVARLVPVHSLPRKPGFLKGRSHFDLEKFESQNEAINSLFI